MKTLFKTLKWSVLAALLISTPGVADDKRLDLDFNAGLAANYDSNVALVELENSAGEADAASVLKVGLGLKAKPGGPLRLDVAYDYSGTRYRDISEFDLDLHHVHAALTIRKSSVDSAIAVDRFAGVLSGEDYLVQTQVSPSVSALFGTRWYLRGGYTRAEKSFATIEDRDARSDALRVDAYLLFDGMNHYLAVSAQALSEDAQSGDYDFHSAMGQLSWGYRIELPGTNINVKAQLRYEQRGYDTVMPDAGDKRVDNRARARLAVTIPFSEHVSVGASVEHTRNTSGLAEARLDRSVYAMEVGVAF